MNRERTKEQPRPDPGDHSPVGRAVDETTERLIAIVANVVGPSEAGLTERPDGADTVDRPARERLEAITRSAESLIENGDRVRNESERLLGLLAERVHDLDGAARNERRAREPHVPSEEAVLHATKMAVTGARRNEIADSLVEKFGVRDPHAIIESILGSAERH